LPGNYLKRPIRYRNAMRPARLHSIRADGPDFGFDVDLGPFGAKNLAGASRRQDDELKREGADTIFISLQRTGVRLRKRT
jgi:hypothetical protein